MKLLYLWVDRFGLAEKLEINFTGEYYFSYNENNTTLTGKENHHYCSVDSLIPPVENDKQQIDMSAIVGDNGSGKTMIALILYSIFQTIPNFQYIIIYNLDGKLIEKHSGGGLNLKGEGIKLEKADENFSIIYYSPHFSSQHCIQEMHTSNGVSFYDVSTSNLLRNDKLEFRNEKTGIQYEKEISDVNAHSFMDFRRIFQLLSDTKNSDEKHSAESSYFFTNPPTKIIIAIQNLDREFLLSELKQSNPKYYESINQFLSISMEEIEKKKSVDKDKFIINLHVAIICNFVRTFQNITDSGVLRPLKERMSQMVLALGLLDFENQGIESRFFHFFETWVTPFEGEEKVEYQNGIGRIQQYHQLIDAVKEMDQIFFSSQREITWNINGDDANLRLFNDLAKKYYATGFITDYLDIQFNPRLSSGEYSQILLYARLYNALKAVVGELHQGCLLFLDEIETTLHPSLQKEIVFDIFHFLKTQFSKINFHVIYATHSPIILSDFQKNNVLQFSRKNNRISITPQFENTFGANIHSLYRNHFYLKNGAIGSFPDKIINGLIKEIQENKNSEDFQKRLDYYFEISGDPLIVKLLRKTFEQRSFDKCLN